jgi:hypothetical protein
MKYAAVSSFLKEQLGDLYGTIAVDGAVVTDVDVALDIDDTDMSEKGDSADSVDSYAEVED